MMSVDMMTIDGSSAISEAGYEDGALYIRFISGKLYRFDGVPFSTFSDLLAAKSVGSFYDNNIRGAFEGVLVD